MLQFKHSIVIVIILHLLISVSCKKKEEVSLHIETLQIDDASLLRGVHFINDSIGFTCGGKRGIEGYIYKTIDGGTSWVKTELTRPRCLYDIIFLNDSVGFAGGDSLYLLTTIDGGENWKPFPYLSNELPYHEQNRPAIKKFSFTSTDIGYFVGGENYNKGIIYKTLDGGLSWTFDTLHQEIKHVSANGTYAWASGFGYIGKAIIGEEFEQLSLTDDVFTSILELEDQSVIAISNTGGIYKSYDEGLNWVAIQKKKSALSKRVSYNGITFIGNKGVIISDNGLIVSDDYGNSWKEVDYNNNERINAIVVRNNSFYTTTEGGTILKFNY